MTDHSPPQGGDSAVESRASSTSEDWQARSELAHELPAWLLSLLLHAALLAILALLVRVAVTPRGARLEAARGAGIVLAHNVDGTAEYYRDSTTAAAPAAESADPSDSDQQALPSAESPPIDVAGVLPEATASPTGSQIAGALPAADAMAHGSGLPSRGSIDGNPAQTSVFGAEGVGNKFVYVFDRSASMDGYGGRPLRAAKAELIASLNDLEKVHQFQIIFYNEQPTVFNPMHPNPPQMLYGDAPSKRLAQNFVRGIVAAGGTRHMDALLEALGMRPDVIFFLTDAAEPQLSLRQLEEIRRRNERVGATIHAIEFGAGPSQGGMNFLKRLAHQNSGTHVYVDVTRLPSR